MKYTVLLKESIYYQVEVEANSKEEAITKSWKEFSDGGYKEVDSEIDTVSIQTKKL